MVKKNLVKAAPTPLSQATKDFLENNSIFDALCCVNDTNGASTGNCVVDVVTACPVEGVCDAADTCGTPMSHSIDFALLLDGLIALTGNGALVTKINEVITHVNALGALTGTVITTTAANTLYTHAAVTPLTPIAPTVREVEVVAAEVNTNDDITISLSALQALLTANGVAVH